MNQHAEVEELSALVDGELAEPQRERLQGHLAVCDRCAALRSDLERTSLRLASLPPVKPTSSQTRQLRQAILGELAPPRSSVRRFVPLAAIGAMAGVLLAVIAFSTVRNDVPSTTSAADQPLQSASFEFNDPEDVRITVLALPEVRSDADRFLVADVGEKQAEWAGVVASAAPQQGMTAEARTQMSDRSTESKAAADGAVASAIYPEGSADVCVRKVLAAQPYPAMPIYAGRATFKSQPAWLIVYVWSRSNSDSAKLNQLQAWLVAPPDCATIHYQSFRNTKTPGG